MKPEVKKQIADFSAVLIAPCGIDCAVCVAFLRKKNPCSGCLTEDLRKGTHQLKCGIKLCAQSQGFLRCAECPKLPCARVRGIDSRYVDHYGVSLIENSKQLHSIGLDAFVESERTQWTCRSCGGRLSIHLGDCPECLSRNPHFHPVGKK